MFTMNNLKHFIKPFLENPVDEYKRIGLFVFFRFVHHSVQWCYFFSFVFTIVFRTSLTVIYLYIYILYIYHLLCSCSACSVILLILNHRPNSSIGEALVFKLHHTFLPPTALLCPRRSSTEGWRVFLVVMETIVGSLL